MGEKLDILKLTLVSVGGGNDQDCGARTLVLQYLGLKLCPLKHRHFVIHINHLHAQHLRGGELRCPMVLCYYGQIEDLLLLSVQGFQDGERAWTREETK